MARKHPAWLVVLLATVLFSSGCLFRSHKVPTSTTVTSVRSATLDELVKTINAQASAVQTMNATVDIDASTGGAKKGKVTEYQQIRGYILLRKPSQLRMIGLFPVVRNRAFDMVSDAQGFKLYIPAKNRFIVGPPDVTTPSKNTLENLRPNVIHDALLLQPIDPQNEIAVLEKSSETVTDSKTKNSVEFPTYVVDVIRKGPQGWYLSRKVVFSRINLLPKHQYIYDKSGQLVTKASYDDYKDYNGMLLPSKITIVRPQEEYTIGLNILKVALNEPLKDEQFALTQPAGAQLVRLGENSTNIAETPGGDRK
jgi:outer membrane lipoprotein-sorting protein